MTAIPCEVRAGDTLRWNRSLPDFPASDGWSLAYTLVGRAGAHNVTASADGADFAIEVPAATTAGWSADSYALTEYVSKGAERYTIGTTRIRVLPDLAAAAGPVDTRSHARKVLDSINAWLESRSIVAGEVQHGERRIKNYSMVELLALRDRLAAIVAREEAADAGRLPRAVLVRL